MDVDDDMADARRLDPVEAVVDQRLARDAYQRLGPRRGQRPHPLAQPRRHHHRALDPCAHAPCPIHAAARLSAETFASNHCRTGTSAGCARSRSSSPHMRGWNWRYPGLPSRFHSRTKTPRMRVLRCAASRSEEHTSELQSLMRISYAVFCLKKKKETNR